MSTQNYCLKISHTICQRREVAEFWQRCRGGRRCAVGAHSWLPSRPGQTCGGCSLSAFVIMGYTIHGYIWIYWYFFYLAVIYVVVEIWRFGGMMILCISEFCVILDILPTLVAIPQYLPEAGNTILGQLHRHLLIWTTNTRLLCLGRQHNRVSSCRIQDPHTLISLHIF